MCIRDSPDAEKECDVCGKQMEPMGEQSEDSDEITVLERKFVLVTHKRQKYRCRCNSAVKTAEGPLKLIVGGRYSLAFAVEVALQKMCIRDRAMTTASASR